MVRDPVRVGSVRNPAPKRQRGCECQHAAVFNPANAYGPRWLNVFSPADHHPGRHAHAFAWGSAGPSILSRLVPDLASTCWSCHRRLVGCVPQIGEFETANRRVARILPLLGGSQRNSLPVSF